MEISHSIASAKNRLPELVHQVEDGHQVRITRRGKPVAILIGLEDYQRWKKNSGSLDAYLSWRSQWQDQLQDESGTFVRDSDQGRDIEL